MRGLKYWKKLKRHWEIVTYFSYQKRGCEIVTVSPVRLSEGIKNKEAFAKIVTVKITASRPVLSAFEGIFKTNSA